jgi:hypothetical protein
MSYRSQQRIVPSSSYTQTRRGLKNKSAFRNATQYQQQESSEHEIDTFLHQRFTSNYLNQELGGDIIIPQAILDDVMKTIPSKKQAYLKHQLSRPRKWTKLDYLKVIGLVVGLPYLIALLIRMKASLPEELPQQQQQQQKQQKQQSSAASKSNMGNVSSFQQTRNARNRLQDIQSQVPGKSSRLKGRERKLQRQMMQTPVQFQEISNPSVQTPVQTPIYDGFTSVVGYAGNTAVGIGRHMVDLAGRFHNAKFPGAEATNVPSIRSNDQAIVEINNVPTVPSNNIAAVSPSGNVHVFKKPDNMKKMENILKAHEAEQVAAQVAAHNANLLKSGLYLHEPLIKQLVTVQQKLISRLKAIKLLNEQYSAKLEQRKVYCQYQPNACNPGIKRLFINKPEGLTEIDNNLTAIQNKIA